MKKQVNYQINIFISILVLLSISTIFYCRIFLAKKILKEGEFQSTILVDCKGHTLRKILSSREGTSIKIHYSKLPSYLIDAVILSEDKRFFSHWGIDFLALSRALWQNIKGRKIVSGASTLTQQMVRLTRNYPRTYFGKALVMAEAFFTELLYSKEKILCFYFNRAPYGNQTFGIGAAAKLYFGKPVEQISLAEAAFLCGIPKSPTLLNPYQHFDLCIHKQKKILELLLTNKKITVEQCKRAKKEMLSLELKKPIFRAPHFCDWIIKQGALNERNKDGKVYTTIDPSIQLACEGILRRRILSLKKANVTNGSALVMDLQTGKILAWVGSADYFNQKHAGQVNGVISLRQPGSTLKPFTYGLYLETGGMLSDLIPDLPLHAKTPGGDFAPRNYDEDFHGPVQVRTALACSYNVPAVRVTEKVGVAALLDKLKRLGFSHLDKTANYYGLGLTLGSAEVTLLELVRAYASLACAGKTLKEQFLINEGSNIKKYGEYVFSPQVCYLLTDVLSDTNARTSAFGSFSSLNFPFDCAAKTGTSKNFRDNWTIGFTRDYVVGVWAGNFEGDPMQGISGISGAAPIFRDIMFHLHQKKYPETFVSPEGIISCSICPVSGNLAGIHCPNEMVEKFISGVEPQTKCNIHQSFQIDIRNGLLAGKDCPKEFVVEKVYENYPALYNNWVAKQCIPRPPQKFSNLGEKKLLSLPDEETFYIAFPDEGDIFCIDPVLRPEYQTISLKAIVPKGVNKIVWWVNEKPYSESSWPFETEWQLIRGKYSFSFSLEKEKTKTNPVGIQVF